MLFFNLLVLLLVVENLFEKQVLVRLLTRRLNLEPLLLILKFAVFFVELLRHVSHELERLSEGLLSHMGILIVFFLFLRVVLQLFLVLLVVCI